MTTTVIEAPVKAPLTDDPLLASTDVKQLREALAFVGAAIPSRPPLAVLLGVLVTANSTGLQLSAFDYEILATEQVPGTGSGKALIPGRLLLDVVKSLDAGPVQLRVNDRVTHVDIVQGDLELSIPLLPIEDYPASPSVGSKPFAALTGGQLAELSRVTVAAGKDDTLPVLTTVCLEQEDGQLRAAATDRYRLAVATLPVRTTLTRDDVKVYASTLSFAVKHLGKADRVELRFKEASGMGGEGHLSFRSGNRQIITRTVSGDFPRYRSLIPTDTPIHFTASGPEVTKAVKQVAIMAARNAPVRVEIAGSNSLSFLAGAQDDAKGRKAVKATVAGVHEDDSVLTAYNPIYLLDGIHAVNPKGEINFAFNTPTRPVILTEKDDQSFLYLLMPVRLT